MKNLNKYSDEYKDTIPLSPTAGGDDTSQKIVPLIGIDTSHTISNMILANMAKDIKAVYPNVPLTHWQYLHKVVMFGGSASEGQVVLPPPGWINAAHRNGTKIYGTVFLSPAAYGGSQETGQVDYMLTHSKVVDQLATIAKTYHVDGYFFNLEDPESQQKTAQYQSFMHALKNTGLGVETYYVQGFTNTFLNKHYTNSVFIDYSLWENVPNTFKNYDSQQVEFGINGGAEPTALQQSKELTTALHEDKASAGEFNFNSILTHQSNQTQRSSAPNTESVIDSNANNFWNTIDDNYKIPAKKNYFINDNNERPNEGFNTFNSFFNTGFGSDFFIKGSKTSFGKWYSMGLQDFLPDLRQSEQYTYSYDYSKAYSGGSSLKLTITNKKTPTAITLYNTKISIQNNDTAIIKAELSNKKTLPTLILTDTAGKVHTVTRNKKIASLPSSWQTFSFDLGRLNGKTIQGIAISLSPVKSEDSINIGQLYIGSKDLIKSSKCLTQTPGIGPIDQNLVPDTVNNKYTHDILDWKKNNAKATRFRIFDGKKFVGETARQHFDYVSTEKNPTICIQSLNSFGTPLDSCVAIH